MEPVQLIDSTLLKGYLQRKKYDMLQKDGGTTF